MAVKPIPDGYATLTPSCALRRCKEAIETYRAVFGAELLLRLDSPDGSVAHCELRFGDSRIMMGEATELVPAHAMSSMIYVADCDAVAAKAVAAGFTVKEPLAVQFWGDRTAKLADPYGNEWYVATHVEDVPEEELKRRMAKAMGG